MFKLERQTRKPISMPKSTNLQPDWRHWDSSLSSCRISPCHVWTSFACTKYEFGLHCHGRVSKRIGGKKKKEETYLFIGGVRKRNNACNSVWVSRAMKVAFSTCTKFTGNIKPNKEKCIICAESQLQRFCWRILPPMTPFLLMQEHPWYFHPEGPAN